MKWISVSYIVFITFNLAIAAQTNIKAHNLTSKFNGNSSHQIERNTKKLLNESSIAENPILPNVPNLPPASDLPKASNLPNVNVNFTSAGTVLDTLAISSIPDNVKTTSSEKSLSHKKPSFTVDHKGKQFLMDGQPFRYISGSFHYFRALPQTWRTKIRTMKAAGLSALQTYVEWSTHNPVDGVYKWDGIADVEQFVRIAAEEGFYVILRPGPFIAAERDMGGFPYWLLTKYPKIKLRTSDPNYLKEVRIWYEHLMPRMQPFLYGNGGPIIMVQVENEYGSNPICDRKYQEWLRNETEKYVKGNAVLFTNDIPVGISCGQIPGVLATLDFPASPDIDSYWEQLRTYQPTGPLVCSEYYTGWLTWWQHPLMVADTQNIIDGLEKILSNNASVNLYMFYGGTNFNYKSGASAVGSGSYSPQITSYDYNAPMDEAGDPTPRYTELRKVIEKYQPLSNVSVPEASPKMKINQITLEPIDVIFSETGRKYLSTRMEKSRKTTTFEAFNQSTGFLLFEAKLPKLHRDPMLLKINGLRDRALIYIDKMIAGVLSRENGITQLPINSGTGELLQIFVENQGRINTGTPNDFKGILENVKIGGQTIYNWNITGFPFDDYSMIKKLISSVSTTKNKNSENNLITKNPLDKGPTIYFGAFALKEFQDTYLNPIGWGKGIAFLNGFNLGRYWPATGPQITLYVPKEILVELNEIVLVELQQAPENSTISFDSEPNLAGFNFPVNSTYTTDFWMKEIIKWRH